MTAGCFRCHSTGAARASSLELAICQRSTRATTLQTTTVHSRHIRHIFFIPSQSLHTLCRSNLTVTQSSAPSTSPTAGASAMLPSCICSTASSPRSFRLSGLRQHVHFTYQPQSYRPQSSGHRAAIGGRHSVRGPVQHSSSLAALRLFQMARAHLSFALQTRRLQCFVVLLPAHCSKCYLPALAAADVGRRRLQRSCHRKSLGRINCGSLQCRASRLGAAARLLRGLRSNVLFQARKRPFWVNMHRVLSGCISLNAFIGQQCHNAR